MGKYFQYIVKVIQFIEKAQLWSTSHAHCYPELTIFFPSSSLNLLQLQENKATFGLTHYSSSEAISLIDDPHAFHCQCISTTNTCRDSGRRERYCIQATRWKSSTAREVKALSTTGSVAIENTSLPTIPLSSWVSGYSCKQKTKVEKAAGCFCFVTRMSASSPLTIYAFTWGTRSIFLISSTSTE